jgi:MFS transporter, DHA2 family, glioxin efflux transporter
MSATHEALPDTTRYDKHDESANDSTDTNQSGESTFEKYPTGMRFVLLAGASIMGVFLISLDQVRTSTGD